jgi:hypothetical protein
MVENNRLACTTMTLHTQPPSSIDITKSASGIFDSVLYRIVFSSTVMSQRQQEMLPTIAPAGQCQMQINAISNKGSKTGSLKIRRRAKPYVQP